MWHQDLILHYTLTATADDTSGPGTVKYFCNNEQFKCTLNSKQFHSSLNKLKDYSVDKKVTARSHLQFRGKVVDIGKIPHAQTIAILLSFKHTMGCYLLQFHLLTFREAGGFDQVKFALRERCFLFVFCFVVSPSSFFKIF